VVVYTSKKVLDSRQPLSLSLLLLCCQTHDPCLDQSAGKLGPSHRIHEHFYYYAMCVLYRYNPYI
jgi:hypothetical protein